MSKSQTTPQVPRRIGLLGGGQLARMLALAAHPLGVEPWVLSTSPQDPAAQVTQFWVQGDPHKLDDVTRFLQKVQIATFESEFLDPVLLQTAVKSSQAQLYPSPSILATVQDRLTQKQLLSQYKIPTAPYRQVSTFADAQLAYDEFAHCVFKQRRMGYDGYGTFVVKNKRELAQMQQRIEDNPHGFICEQFIPFQRELAFMALRGRAEQGKKSFFTLPLVESTQIQSRCYSVVGPVKHLGIKKLSQQIQNMLQSENYVGILGVELFQTRQGLLVNELAPRVHNTGHYSQNALSVDQFTLHLKAVLGLSIAVPKLLSPGFCMINLLGSGEQIPNWDLPEEAHLHWYGKQENRLGRKMGHYNVLGLSGKQALKQALGFRKRFTV